MVIQMKGKTLGGGIHSGRRRSTFASFSFATAGRRAFKTANVLAGRLHDGNTEGRIQHNRLAHVFKFVELLTYCLLSEGWNGPFEKHEPNDRRKGECWVGDTYSCTAARIHMYLRQA